MESHESIRTDILAMLNMKDRDQQWLAKKMGVSAPYLNDLLQGRRNWSDDMKLKACAALEVPPAYLFDRVHEQRCACAAK